MEAMSTQEMMHALLDPAVYPHARGIVQLHTHFTDIALAVDFVFKIKNH